MDDIIIRKAKAEEGPVLAQIEKECFPAAEAADEVSICGRLKTFPDKFFVAEQKGKVIGFINGAVTDKAYLPDEMYHDNSLHLPNGAYQTVFGLDVLPEYRCRGVAAKLLETMISAAKEEGKKGVVLTCKDRLVHYYEKFGFVCHGKADSTHGGASWNDMQLHF